VPVVINFSLAPTEEIVWLVCLSAALAPHRSPLHASNNTDLLQGFGLGEKEPSPLRRHEMPSVLNLKNSVLAFGVFGFLAFSHGTAKADPISVCTGPACSTTNVTGSIVAGNGTVTITLTNNLTNAQVVSVIQNVSGVYFQVSGYNGGAVSLSASNSTQSTDINNAGTASLQGPVNPTGWGCRTQWLNHHGLCDLCLRHQFARRSGSDDYRWYGQWHVCKCQRQHRRK